MCGRESARERESERERERESESAREKFVWRERDKEREREKRERERENEKDETERVCVFEKEDCLKGAGIAEHAISVQLRERERGERYNREKVCVCVRERERERKKVAWRERVSRSTHSPFSCAQHRYLRSQHGMRVENLLPESQGQNLALTLIYVPYSLDSDQLASVREHVTR